MAKFRVWDKLKNEMIYDAIEYELRKLETDSSDSDKYTYIGFEHSERFVVMQYVYLKDRNGKEIYERDYLDFDPTEWGEGFELEMIVMENLIGDWNYCGTKSDVREWREVCGNVFEGVNKRL